jgi:hypothetical protein
MKKWKIFLPAPLAATGLSELSPVEVLVDNSREPAMESLFLQSDAGSRSSLCWGYSDVEFKFEIYGVVIGQEDQVASSRLTVIHRLDGVTSVDALLRTEWIRPADRGEVPEHFEQIIEEGGAAMHVPAAASAVGTVVSGLAFKDSGGAPILVVSLNEKERYSLKLVCDIDSMNDAIGRADAWPLVDIYSWHPPLDVARDRVIERVTVDG